MARHHRLRNAVHSLLLLAGMAGLAGYLGWVVFGDEGLLWALLIGPLVVGLSPHVSPRLVWRLSGAVEIAPYEAPGLYRTLLLLSQRAGLAAPPRLFYMPTSVLNAFATGTRKDAAIVVTDGLLRTLDSREVAGVLAHEIAHIRSNDVWVMTLADVVGRVTTVLSFAGQALFIVLLPLAVASDMRMSLVPYAVLILAPALSIALQLALSRTREYDADVAAVELARDARGLASALHKLERLQGGWIERILMARPPKWLRTHPDTKRRIERLLHIER